MHSKDLDLRKGIVLELSATQSLSLKKMCVGFKLKKQAIMFQVYFDTNLLANRASYHVSSVIFWLRQFQINHLFNGSFATLCRQAGRKKLKLQVTVLQVCARKTS